MRYTKEVIGKILNANEGKTIDTVQRGRNSKEYNTYLITGGKVIRKHSGRNQNGRYSSTAECDLTQIRNLIKSHEYELKTDI